MPNVRTTYQSKDDTITIEVEDDEGRKLGIPLSSENAARLIENLLDMLPLYAPLGLAKPMILRDLQSPAVATGTTQDGEFLLDVYQSSDTVIRFTLDDGQWAGICREVLDRLKETSKGRGDNPVQ